LISSRELVLEDCGLLESAMASIREVSFQAEQLRKAAEAWKPGEAAAELARSDPDPEPDESDENRPSVDFEHLKLWWAAYSAAYPQHPEKAALASARATFPGHFVPRQWVRDLRGPQLMGRPSENKGK
jgi:hypothetical protein